MRTLRMCHGGVVLLPTVLVADRWYERMRGLLGRTGLGQGTGMLLHPCGAVHTIGMRFVIDVVYFDAAWRVVHLVPGLRPNRFSGGGRRACATLEIQSGGVDLSLLAPGETVSFNEGLQA